MRWSMMLLIWSRNPSHPFHLQLSFRVPFYEYSFWGCLSGSTSRSYGLLIYSFSCLSICLSTVEDSPPRWLCGSNKAQKHHQEPVACRCRWLLQLTLQYWSQHAVSPSTLQHHVFKPKYFPLEQDLITAQLTHHTSQNPDCSDSTVEKPKRKRRKKEKKREEIIEEEKVL